MTDINELTAKLKAAAQAALPANERLSVLPPDDIFDISLVEGEQLDRDITVMNSFNEIANPANILALTEELEAAEKRIAELEARTPYGYLRQCDGQIQISIGSEQPHNRSGGYATPWFAIYTAAAGKGEAS